MTTGQLVSCTGILNFDDTCDLHDLRGAVEHRAAFMEDSELPVAEAAGRHRRRAAGGSLLMIRKPVSRTLWSVVGSLVRRLAS